jgi:restriction system protein
VVLKVRATQCDIRAFLDAFAFEPPPIRFQVKHRKEQATQQEIQQFAGVVGSSGENYNGLFVFTGGFTPHATREAEKPPDITLIDRQSFVSLLLEHYEKLEPQFNALVPLRKVYIPVPPTLAPCF